MNNSVQEKPFAGVDLLKWLAVISVLGIGIYGNSHYANDYSVYMRALPLMLLAAAAVFVAMQTVHGVAFGRLVKESRAEIRRVVWPTRKEATQTTLIVLLFVFVMALILWLIDWTLNQLVSLVMG